MSTMIENRWDPRMQNQQGPITSGFVSNSDIRQRERQEQIKWERQREYEDYQSKPNSPVYYKVGSTGGMSLPIGGYEESRKIYDDQRQKECIDFMAKKKDAEEKKREDRYVNAQRSYRPPPEAEMYDHNQITRELNEEKKKEYNDYLDNPNMGFRQYEERKKLLSQERKTEYNRFLDNKKKKQQEEASRIKRRHRYTPPGGLPIGNYEIQRKMLQEQLREDYKKDILKQRRDQLMLRAKEFQLDMAPDYLGNLSEERPLVGSPTPRNLNDLLHYRYQRERENNAMTNRRPPPTPPTGLNIATEEQRRQAEAAKKSIYRDELLQQQKEQLYTRAKAEGEIPVINRVSPTHQTSPRGRPPPHPEPERRAPSYDQPKERTSQQTPKYWDNGRQAMSPKSVHSDHKNVQGEYKYVETRAQKSQDRQRPGQYGQSDNEIRTGFFDDRRISPLNRDTRHDEYQDYLNKKHKEEDMRRQRLEEQRNAPRPEIRKGDYYDADAYEQKKQNLNSQRKEEYQNFLSKSPPGSPIWGLPIGQYKYIPFRTRLEMQRNREYNDYLEKQKGATAQKNGETDFETQRRVALAQERNKEYNDFIENKSIHYGPIQRGMGRVTKPLNSRPKSEGVLSKYGLFPPYDKSNMRFRPVTSDHYSASLNINLDAMSARETALATERKQEYNEYLKKLPYRKAISVRERTPVGKYKGSLNFDEEERFQKARAKKKALNMEYNKFLAKEEEVKSLEGISPRRPKGEIRDTTPERNISLNFDEEGKYITGIAKKISLNKEYNRFLSENDTSSSPRKIKGEITPEEKYELSLNFDEEEKLQREREKKRAVNLEYNHFLAQDEVKQNKVEPLNLGEDFTTKRQKELAKERHQEYLEFLDKQNTGPPFTARKPAYPGLPIYQEKYDPFYKQLKSMRNNEYNNLLSQANQPSNRLFTPEDLQGLPMNQQRYDRQRRYQEMQRNKEYNEHLSKKGGISHPDEEQLSRRDMTLKTYMENQTKSEMHDKFRNPVVNDTAPENFGLPIGQHRYDEWKKHLEQERTKEMQELQAQKTPEPSRREWRDTSAPKGIIAGIDSYNYDKRQTFAEERRKEYKDIMEKKAAATSPVKPRQEPEIIEPPQRKPTTPINLNSVKIFPVDDNYAKHQLELRAERKKNFKAFAEKKTEMYKKQQEDRDNFKMMLDRELMESPPIIPIGEYDSKKKQFQQEAHQEMVHFLESQPQSNRDKEFWNKVSKPKILPQSGEYKNRKTKLNDELRKDWRDFVLKQPPQRERIKDFGTPGAVLFTGEYEQTKKKVREERTKDFHDHMKKYGSQPTKRMPDQKQPNPGTIGFVAGMGYHERERERMNKQRQDEYNKYLNEKSQAEHENMMKRMGISDQTAYGKAGMPKGRPNWVDGRSPPDSWYRQEPPPFNKSPGPGREQERPRSYRRQPTPSYQDILDSKRKEEASYRRFDDPEYSRTGGPGERPYDRYD